jgi:hypothetical protein
MYSEEELEILKSLYDYFITNQEELDEGAHKILYQNLWSLYE